MNCVGAYGHELGLQRIRFGPGCVVGKVVELYESEFDKRAQFDLLTFFPYILSPECTLEMLGQE